jgi:hypothetical protein
MCRSTYLDPSASAIAEPPAREEDHEGYQQQQPKQRAYSDPPRYGCDYKNNQKQLYEAHGSLLWVECTWVLDVATTRRNAQRTSLLRLRDTLSVIPVGYVKT